VPYHVQGPGYFVQTILDDDEMNAHTARPHSIHQRYEFRQRSTPNEQDPQTER